MYKDKDKQREANKQAQARFKAKGITDNELEQAKGITNQGITERVLPLEPKSVSVIPKRGKDIKCFEDLPPDIQQTINQMSRDDAGKIDQAEKAKRTTAAIKYQHLFPDSYGLGMCPVCTGVVTGKPGDADYNGVCTEEWRQARGV